MSNKMPAYKRKKFNGLYFHSSPPRIIPMNNYMSVKARDDRGGSKEAIVIKPSTIRIWIHDKDIPKLTKVLWEGMGMRLRTETSNNPKVKRFLDSVPYVMNLIKQIHTACINNDIDELKARTQPPVPRKVLSSKDANGLTPLHKAAGLAHTRLVEYLLSLWPQAATEVDCTGRTPLHYAASAKNNDRCFNLLVQAGSDETSVDNKSRTANFYKSKPSEIDRSLLTVIPEAPRMAQQVVATEFDWNNIGEDGGLKPPTKLKSTFYSENNINQMLANAPAKIPPVTHSPTRQNSFEKLGNNNLKVSQSLHDNLDNTSEPELVAHTPKSPDLDNSDDHYDVEEGAVMAANEHQKLYERSERLEDAKQKSESNQTTAVIADQDVDKEERNSSPRKKAANAKKAETVETEEEEENNEQEEDGNNDAGGSATGNHNENESEMEENHHEDQNGDDDPDSEHSKVPDIDNDENNNGLDDGVQDEQSLEMNDGFGEDYNDLETGNEEEEADLRSAKSIKSTRSVKSTKSTARSIKSTKSQRSFASESIAGNGIEDDDIVEPLSMEDLQNHDEDEADIFMVEDDEKTKHDLNGDSESDHMLLEDDADGNEKISESPSPALEFEGIVEGEPTESGQLQSQGGGIAADEEEVKLQALIDSGDMEELASLVLNGQGATLVGMETAQPEIQAFLDNVPAYMNKIRKVHYSAREGSLRDLQSALDRRKFAIAKDNISPDGATPLHVATIFGHSGIVRYLAGRFPETTSAADNNGRTALHYAAVIQDNGHFYNLLVNLGANTKAEDNEGRSPEYYLSNSSPENIMFTHKSLLNVFGAKESLADEMLNDQDYEDEEGGEKVGGLRSRSNQQVEIPLFRTEEGRYLATSLGDPLIKGLTEVANKRPDDPIAFLANYLSNFANNKTIDNKTADADPAVDKGQTPPQEQNNNEKPVDKKPDIQVATKYVEHQDELVPPSSDGPESALTSEDRDEHGQSMLHFASARSHGRNALIQMIEESGTSITYRDELYRTARDVALQASQPENAKEIDRFLLSLAARGDVAAFETMVIEGYDHILDVTDNDGNSIIHVAESRRNEDLVELLHTIQDFEEDRENLHSAIRSNDINEIKMIINRNDGSLIVRAKNYYGRCALHIAILKENEEIVDFLATHFKQALKIGDNLERTALHYAMGVSSVESLSRILIKNGAKRVLKDLKGRQPSYYFMNRADISRLQEEEE